jgi:hypothetical protein
MLEFVQAAWCYYCKFFNGSMLKQVLPDHTTPLLIISASVVYLFAIVLNVVTMFFHQFIPLCRFKIFIDHFAD